ELVHKVRQAVQRRQAEHNLRESERTSRALLDATTDAVALITCDLTILAVNESFARRFGLEPDQMTRRNLHEFIPLDLGCDRKARVTEVIASKKPVRFEDRRDELFLENSFYPIFDESGDVFRLAMYSRDITDRKRSEQDLHTAYEQIAADEEELREKYNELSLSEKQVRESEERYRSLVETTGTGYVVLDMQGKVLDANDEYIRLTGRSSLDEIMGRSVTEWTAPYDLERNSEEVSRCARNGFVRGLEIDYMYPDRTIQPLEVNASVVSSESGDIILTLCRDISIRKRERRECSS
ncbi:MAG: hypothetical protein CVV33_10365, partial [Methanomicrobiales archaeon HGW-Methanomicrobiales-4]